MLEALGSLPVRVLLTLGGVLPTSAVDAPPNVTVRGFVEHALVLPHMAAVVSHGGLSTIASAVRELLADSGARREARRFAHIIDILGGGATAITQVAHLHALPNHSQSDCRTSTVR
jgi:UDP:flavonoid glycosyltransferase YjiC (YdhE family)